MLTTLHCDERCDTVVKLRTATNTSINNEQKADSILMIKFIRQMTAVEYKIYTKEKE